MIEFDSNVRISKNFIGDNSKDLIKKIIDIHCRDFNDNVSRSYILMLNSIHGIDDIPTPMIIYRLKHIMKVRRIAA